MALKFFKQLTAPLELSPETESFEEEWIIEILTPIATTALTSIETIKSDARYPKRFEQHKDHPKFYMISAKLDQDKTSPNIRLLRVQWSTKIPSALIKNGKPDYDENPLNRPVSVEASFYTMPQTIRMCYGKVRGARARPPTLPIYDDKKGMPYPEVAVHTSAGEPIFMQIEREIRVFSCVKNVKNLPLFMGKGGTFINSDKVKFQGISFAPLELMICHIRLSKPYFEFGEVFYIFDFDLFVAPDESGWCEKKRDAGFHEKVVTAAAVTNRGRRNNTPEQSYLKAIAIGPPENPQPPSQPVLLTEFGRAFRNLGKGQAANTPQKDRTGPILSTESPGTGGTGLTNQDFEDSELKFYPRLAIPFKKWVPLT